jgi:hypothetical protein
LEAIHCLRINTAGCGESSKRIRARLEKLSDRAIIVTFLLTGARLKKAVNRLKLLDG